MAQGEDGLLLIQPTDALDKASGRNADRPGPEKCLEYLRPGDVLLVLSLDRLGRSVEDLIRIVAELKRRGVRFHSIHERLGTTTPVGCSSATSSPR